MITKKVLQLATIKAIIAPFQFLAYRMQCNDYHSHLANDTIEYADATVLQLGNTSFWTAYDIQLLRMIVNMNLNSYKKQRENKINRTGLSAHLISLVKEVINCGLYYVQLTRRTSQKHIQENAVDILKKVIKHKKQDLMLGMMLYFGTKVVHEHSYRLLRRYIPVQNQGFLKRYCQYTLQKSFILFLCYPLYTIANKMMAGEISFKEAFKQGNFLAGFKLFQMTFSLEFLFGEILQKLLKSF